MIVLHGTWHRAPDDPPAGKFFIWGETSSPLTKRGRSRSKRSPIKPHPFQASPYEVQAALTALCNGSIDPKSLYTSSGLNSFLLPSYAAAPMASSPIINESEGAEESVPAYGLVPWNVEGSNLSPGQTALLLARLPEDTGIESGEVIIGSDLRFWSEVSKFVLELAARQRFVPSVMACGEGSAKKMYALWQPALDDPDDAQRISLLAETMPPACRSLVARQPDGSLAPPSSARKLILGFLTAATDDLLREWVGGQRRSRISRSISQDAPLSEKWSGALLSKEPVIAGAPSELRILQQSLSSWLAQVGALGEMPPFRTCFRLEAPEIQSDRAVAAPKPKSKEWVLRYFLQATDDLSLLVPAEKVWRKSGETLRFLNRRFDQPQEKLLLDLGRAARLFSPIEESLRAPRPEACALTTDEAYAFLKESASLLEESGFGALVPPWWDRSGPKGSRLGVRLELKGKQDPGTRIGHGFMGLRAVAEYNWQLAIGDEPLSPEEFERIAALKVPLVRVRGQWIELRKEDIEATIAFWKSREKDKLTVSDALRLGLGGDTVGLAITSFNVGGWLEDLIKQFSDGERLSELPAPEEFRGTLRPYQAKGLSWLAFMRQWGLGACLADDMGLGKCSSADALIVVNGILIKAEDVWSRYAGEATFDGEGYWAEPTEPLLTNSIDEKTGRIVQARMRRLYRQRVHEHLRTIKLEDGSNVTITCQHKLLTNKGWTNEFRVGDYVCVPAKLIWDGKPEDPDLVKFLAWQIAEGYELRDRARVSITQKDASVLEGLKQSLHRFGEKYGIKINRPIIHAPASNRAADLVLHSAEYRRFLEARGYEWGRLSREKGIPPFIMQSDLDSVRLFLRNYFDAEAAVIESMRVIEISTASPLLIQQLSSLLRRFGIWMRISAKQKRATNGSRIFRTYYISTMGGNAARKFCKEIGFSNPDKQGRLEKICEQKSNTNVEGIPASEMIAQTIATTRLPVRHFGMHNTVYINGSQQFSRTSLERVISAFDDVLSGGAERQYRKLNPSRWTTQTLGAYAKLDKELLYPTRKHLQHLLDQEVYYCKIKAIEGIEHDGWVYDFEVEEHHNFVANNILCHNTIQFIAFLLHDKVVNPDRKPTLLICPMSVVGNWQREVARFAPSLRVLIHHGTSRQTGSAFAAEASRHDLVISTYSLAHRDAEHITAVEWEGVVLDEAQNIKNPAAKQTQAIRKLYAGYRMTLTGTPVENRLSELWSIMEFLNPGYLGPAAGFRRQFAIPIERYQDSEQRTKLRQLVSPFVLRRLKTDPRIIQDLPEKMEMKVFCPLTREQATLYEAIVKDMIDKIERAEGIERRGQVLAALLKLKQVCNHPAQFLRDGSAIEGRSGKLARLGEMLEEALSEGDRSLVFTQFYEMGELLRKHLQKLFGREALFLHGGVPQKKREHMIARFQEDADGPPIFILSLKAGGVGLNLMRANRVFHFDRWWNPAVENQATDRAFRIGQTKNVQVHKFVCIGTLEERIDAMIEAKKDLAESIIGAGEDWITEMSTDQLRDLFKLRREALSDE